MNDKTQNKLVLIVLLWLAAFASLAAPPTLPANLNWQTNDTDPAFADPNAKRGGRFRTYTPGFPLTLRQIGPDANNTFANYLRANSLSLVSIHPNTLNPIPELATHWAFDPDGKTVYFRLDPDARWSDGAPVTADDYLFTMEFMRSKFILDPFSNNYYGEILKDVVKYDDYTIAVAAADAKPNYELLFQVAIGPTPRHFHKLDENWVKNYNWRVEPNTGPYQISEVRKGKYVEFARVEDWWGSDKRFYRHRFNVDYVRVKIIRDQNAAYSYFAKGELDSFGLVMPRLWYKKAQGRPFENGYIGRIKFYNDVPQSPQGFFLNTGDPILADRNVRLGLAYAINVDKVIRTVLRNDYERLQTMNEGFGDYSNRDIHARPFDIAKANQHFDNAGWQTRGPDGIRTRNGERLSLRVTYYSQDHTSRLVVFKQEALKAGVELTLQYLDPSAAYKQIMEKKHQIALMAWAGGGLTPRYWEHFHSDNANKPATNNITNTADPLMDREIIAYQKATTKEERVRLARELELMVHESAVFIPTYKIPYTREAFWRWIRLPQGYATRTSTEIVEPFGTSSGGLFWIDEDVKTEVQRARPLGEKFDPIEILDETWRVGAQPQISGGGAP
ncbi:MAG: extracellular solute-binding protein [Spongiibacteraceae bacterium]